MWIFLYNDIKYNFNILLVVNYYVFHEFIKCTVQKKTYFTTEIALFSECTQAQLNLHILFSNIKVCGFRYIILFPLIDSSKFELLYISVDNTLEYTCEYSKWISDLKNRI